MSEWREYPDEAIDEALMSYVEAPENEGLEQRILARVSKRTTGKPRTRSLMLALSSAALVAGCLFWWGVRRTSIEIKPVIEIALVSKNHGSASEPLVSPRRIKITTLAPDRRRRIRKVHTDPKLSQFPSPQQVGNEERALLQLARLRAEDAIKESNYLDAPVKPIEVVALSIKPLQ